MKCILADSGAWRWAPAVPQLTETLVAGPANQDLRIPYPWFTPQAADIARSELACRLHVALAAFRSATR